MSTAPDIYGHSLTEGLELAVVAPTGEVCLLQRPADAPLFSNHHGLPARSLPPDAGFSGMLETLETLLYALTGSSRHLSVTPLGQWDTPPFTPHRVAAGVLLVRLEHRPDLADGRWWFPEEALERWDARALLLEPPALATLRHLDRGVPFALDPDLIEVRPGLRVIPLRTPTIPPATHTNCYLFGDEALVAIDPASPYQDEQERLETALDRLAGEGHRLTAVLLTHHHWDHTGGAMRLRERYGVPILAHPETAPLVHGDITLSSLLDDLETYPADHAALTALFTPGHAYGHLCFQDTGSRSIIMGDMVAGWGSIVVAPPEGNMGRYLESLERLKATQPSLLLPAHGPPIGGALEKIDEYLEHRRQRERQVIEALRVSPASAAELVRQIYVDLPPMLETMAQASVQAHLNKLLDEARVRDDSGRYHLLR